MRYIFKFPDIGEGLEEGKIIEWYVKKGQSIESGDRCGHQDSRQQVFCFRQPLGFNYLRKKKTAYFLLHSFCLQLTKAWHYIGTNCQREITEDFFTLVQGAAVARIDNGKASLQPGQLFGIADNAIPVATICPAYQQEDVGLIGLYPSQILAGQFIGKNPVNLCSRTEIGRAHV